ncbi:hypothetical protein C0J52_04409 [Blattella germanica]|nr:hypothetical protein C0J52_04409 [Blattella germanica]
MANFNNSSTEEYEVVISGMSGVFPESKNIDVFRDKLLAKENLITQRDDENYRLGSEDFINYLGQIDDLKKFDGNFFGFTRLLADATDPVQRITLEKMYEAALDAGKNMISN